MNYIGWILLFFGALRLLVAFTNWASRLFLPTNENLTSRPMVSILIPARNEESTLGKLLTDLSEFTYKSLEIIIYNDNSTDKTAATVAQFASKNSIITLINGGEPEKGWLGKNYACHQLSLAARGDIWLFLDADVRVRNGIIENSVAFSQKHKLKLLSIFPKQNMTTVGPRLAVPLMNWILLSLLPLILVRISPWQSFSAANGQFMLFDSATYKRLLPHKKFRKNKVEDIAILNFYKKQNLQVATLLGDENISCNMYNSLEEAKNGFTKNIFQFFGGSASISILFALATTFAPVYLLIFNGATEGLLYIGSTVLIRIFISLASKQSISQNLILMPLQHSVFLQIIFSAYKSRKNKTILWKGRNIN